MTGTSAEMNGTRLCYESAGAGSPIVFLNPGGLDCRVWEPQWRVLSRSHRVLRYDPRGWGKSDPPQGPFSHLRDLEALMNFVEIDGAHLVGSSFGGSLALDFCAAFPRRALSAVLVGAGGPQNGFPVPADLPRIFAPVAEAMRTDFARGIDVWLDVDTRMPQTPGLRARVRDNALDNEAYWKTPPSWPERLKPPVSERLDEIDVPMLLAVGEGDFAYTHQIAETLEKGLPRARRIVVEKAGHLVHLDRPDEFNELVLRFVEDVDSAR